MSSLKTQVGGDHYKDMPIQPMEYSMANGLDACQHSIVKYVTRFRQKGGLQDLEKARHVLDMLIEFEQKNAPPCVITGDLKMRAHTHHANDNLKSALTSLLQSYGGGWTAPSLSIERPEVPLDYLFYDGHIEWHSLIPLEGFSGVIAWRISHTTHA